MEEETLKRSKTSPRTNAFNEVISLIDSHIGEWEKEETRGQAMTVLRTLRQDVEAMIGTKHAAKVDKDDTTVASVGKKGTHFVGVTGDEKVLYLRRDREGVYHTDDDGSETVAHIYGPFSTEGGARYAVTHGTYHQRTLVQ